MSKDKIVEYLKDHPNSTVKDIASAINQSDRNVKTLLKELDNQLIIDDKEKAKRYSLKDSKPISPKIPIKTDFIKKDYQEYLKHIKKTKKVIN